MFGEIKLAEPVFLRNLVLYPLESSDEENGSSVKSIEEVTKNGLTGFQELTTPQIDKVLFKNNTEHPVLMLDGEEIVGALQNRIITMSHITDAHSSEEVDVVCVEEGRWDELGAFAPGYFSFPGIRAILSKSRHSKIDLQKTVWQEIDRKLSLTRTSSMTSSMHDIYNNMADEVMRYLEDFNGLNHNTVGIIALAGTKLLGCDIFRSQNIYKKFENKLLPSYALEALEYMKTTKKQDDPRSFFKEIKDITHSIKLRRRNVNLSIKTKDISGQLLIHNKRFLHLSAFLV